MESKEKFYLLKELVIIKSRQYKQGCELRNLESNEHISIQDCVSDIEKDLNRLEKQDKVIEIIKNKRVNVNDEIYSLDNYYEYLTFAKEALYIPELILSKDEWNLLKEVFG